MLRFHSARGKNNDRTPSVRCPPAKFVLRYLSFAMLNQCGSVSGSPADLINSRLESLPPEQQLTFLELSYADPDVAKEDIPLSIFQTNGISAGKSGIGIFPKTARLNHACSSGFNSVYTWREKNKVLGLCSVVASNSVDLPDVYVL